MNSHLRKRGKDALIEDVQKDFSDGIKLIQFLEVISTKSDWCRRYDKKPRMKIQKIQNVDMCMKFLKAEGVKLVAIQAENIVDGDLTLILGMIWTIIQQYQIADISEEELTAKEALLLWCQKKVSNDNCFAVFPFVAFYWLFLLLLTCCSQNIVLFCCVLFLCLFLFLFLFLFVI